jgi:hypothetical protein
MDSEVLDRLARIETKIDAFKDGHNDQETRIRKLEGWRAYTIGVAAALSAGISYLFPNPR